MTNESVCFVMDGGQDLIAKDDVAMTVFLVSVFTRRILFNAA